MHTFIKTSPGISLSNRLGKRICSETCTPFHITYDDTVTRKPAPCATFTKDHLSSRSPVQNSPALHLSHLPLSRSSRQLNPQTQTSLTSSHSSPPSAHCNDASMVFNQRMVHRWPATQVFAGVSQGPQLCPFPKCVWLRHTAHQPLAKWGRSPRLRT